MDDFGATGGDDAIWTREEVQSPCVKICVVHPAERICTGCLRTIDEIGAWSRMGNAERAALLEELPARADLLKKRRGGRAARRG
ncbi:MAG: DUF1289 domain-containing protein [Litoreibacter sp.]|nr:DUF1289 domain-containing protein [Litoreibacter sp.]